MRIDNKGYAVFYNAEKKKIDLEHRYIWEKENGPIPEGFVIHHKNGIRNDNRLENLECISAYAHSKIPKFTHNKPTKETGLSAWNTRSKHTNDRTTCIICNETEEEFDSITLASIKFGCTWQNIVNMLSGKQRTAMGHTFRYKYLLDKVNE